MFYLSGGIHSIYSVKRTIYSDFFLSPFVSGQIFQGGFPQLVHGCRIVPGHPECDPHSRDRPPPRHEDQGARDQRLLVTNEKDQHRSFHQTYDAGNFETLDRPINLLQLGTTRKHCQVLIERR